MEKTKEIEVRGVSEQCNRFGMKLANTLKSDSNVFISPFSIFQILTIIANGAEQETFSEIKEKLNLPSLPLEEMNTIVKKLNEMLKLSGETILEIANSVWISADYKLSDNFGKSVSTNHNAEIKPLHTVEEVNKWVSAATHEKITKILDKIGPLIKLALINAIYFKGAFKFPFDEKHTVNETFHATKGDKELPMMKLNREFQYFESDEFQAVQLNYSSSSTTDFTSSVILPQPGKTVDGVLESIQNKPEVLNHFSKRKGKLELPRFKVEYSTSVKAALEQLGLSRMFHHALPNIAEPKNLVVDEIIHKTYLEVNEKGAEAAAVTVATMRSLAVLEKPAPFHMRVDRPFLFLIEEKNSGLILFLGKIENP